MDIRTQTPLELYGLIIANNALQVAEGLRQNGIQIGNTTSETELMQALLSLKQGRSAIEYVEIVSRVLNVELLPQGDYYQELTALLDNNVGSLVVENYLANSPKDIEIVYASELNRMRLLSSVGIFSIVVFAIGFIILLLRQKKS